MNIDAVLQKALLLIQTDLQTIDTSTQEGPLDRNEASKLTDYVKTLVAVSKNNREVQKLEGLHTVSDEELEKLAKEALEALGGSSES